MATRQQDIPQEDKYARLLKRAGELGGTGPEPPGTDKYSRLLDKAGTLEEDRPQPVEGVEPPPTPVVEPPPTVDLSKIPPFDPEAFRAAREGVEAPPTPAPVPETVPLTVPETVPETVSIPSPDPTVTVTPMVDPLLKEGVKWDPTPEVQEVWPRVEAIAQEVTGGRPFVTSGREGLHMEDSVHYEGGAFDLRTRHLDPDTTEIYRKRLAEELGPGWTVIYEGGDQPHIHAQRKRGYVAPDALEAPRTTLPPSPAPAAPPTPDEPSFLSRIFHETKGRLGLGAEAARGLARTPGQMIEGAGGMFQAAAAHQEAALQERPAWMLPEELGGPEYDPERAPGRFISRFTRKAGEELEELGAESQEFYPASQDIDRMDLTDLNALVAGGTEAIGQLGTQIALAAATGGGSAITQFLMFAGPTVAMEGGNAFLETRERLTSTGMDEEEAELLAANVGLTTGLGALAIERIPAARFVFNKIPGAERLFGQRMARALSGRAGRVTSMVSGMAAEGVEESLQEVWSSVVQDIQADNPEAYKDLDRRLLASGVFGGIGGAFGGVVTHRPDGTPISPEEAPPEAPPGPETVLPAPEPSTTVTGVKPPPVEIEEAIPEPTKEEKKSLRRRVEETIAPGLAAELETAYTDKTGLRNQTAWDAAKERVEADPEQEVTVFDIRDFKAINDLNSYEAGDATLQTFADGMKDLEALGIPRRDQFRLGGDEFIVVHPPGTGDAVGKQVAEAFGEVPVFDKEGNQTAFTMRARFGSGQSLEEANANMASRKKEETGPKFRDKAAEAEERVQPPEVKRPEDLSPENQAIFAAARAEKNPMPKVMKAVEDIAGSDLEAQLRLLEEFEAPGAFEGEDYNQGAINVATESIRRLLKPKAKEVVKEEEPPVQVKPYGSAHAEVTVKGEPTQIVTMEEAKAIQAAAPPVEPAPVTGEHYLEGTDVHLNKEAVLPSPEEGEAPLAIPTTTRLRVVGSSVGEGGEVTYQVEDVEGEIFEFGEAEIEPMPVEVEEGGPPPGIEPPAPVPTVRAPLDVKGGDTVYLRSEQDGYFLQEDTDRPITTSMPLTVTEVFERPAGEPNTITVEVESGEEFDFFDSDLRKEGDVDLEAAGQETLFGAPSSIEAPKEVSRETGGPDITTLSPVHRELVAALTQEGPGGRSYFGNVWALLQAKALGDEETQLGILREFVFPRNVEISKEARAQLPIIQAQVHDILVRKEQAAAEKPPEPPSPFQEAIKPIKELARQHREQELELQSGVDSQTGFILTQEIKEDMAQDLTDLVASIDAGLEAIFEEFGPSSRLTAQNILLTVRDKVTADSANRAQEKRRQREAEEESRILLGKNVASEEELAKIETREDTEDAAQLEEAPPSELGPEQAETPEGAIGRGELDEAPGAGSPGGPRNVREALHRDTETAPHLDTGSDREVSRGSGTPGSRAGEGRGDRVRGEARVRGLDFRIEPGQEVFDRGDITKTKNNIEAIRTLRLLEAQGRQATAEEQEILVKYVGWGGLPNALEPGNKKRWKELNAELLELLTDEELRAAKRSVLNAHYTSIPVIRAMHDAMEHLGVPEDALVLEPSMGNGHFIGAGPPTYRWFGVELDQLTGKIAQLLYPKQDINVRGFETVPLPDDHFDAAMSNVPFGDFKVDDPAYRSLKFNIHNYFFAKALDKVRPGGVVAFITSMFTMDSVDSSVRKYLAERADLLGAIRLPNTAFKANAATEVTTDIIFLRKKQEGQEGTWEGATPPDAWMNLDTYHSADGALKINAYFKNNQGMMLGTMGLQGTMRARDQPALVAPEGQNLGNEIHQAVSRMPADVVPARPGPVATAISLPEVVDAASQEGSMRVLDTGEIYQIQSGALVDARVFKTQRKNVKDLIGLRDQARTVLQLQRDDASKLEIDQAQKELGRLHDQYVETRGPINKETVTKTNRVMRPNLTPFKSDPDMALVSALEIYDADTNTAERAAIFSERVIEVRKPITEVEEPADALPVSLSELGKVDVPFMAQLAGIPETEMIEALRGLIYQDPATDTWTTEDEYLSGNVKEKLRVAQERAQTDNAYQENVQALEAVQPEDLKPSEISAGLGSPWIHPEAYEAFFNEVLDRGEFNQIRVGHMASQALFTIEANRDGYGTLESTVYGTKRVGAGRLFELSLNQRHPTVYDRTFDNKSVKNVRQTLEAREKQAELKAKFEDWLWSSEFATDLAAKYNEEYNTDRERQFDGSHLRPAGISPTVDLHPHQLDSAWRIISQGNTLLAHVVGAGKTWTMIVAGMEQRRMGLVKKPMYVVPNHMLEQFSREFLQLYPSARILTADEKAMDKGKRQQLMGKVATGDWDAVIITHAGFKKMDVTPETRAKFLEAEVAKLEESIREQKEQQGGANKNLLKTVEKAKEKMETKLSELGKKEEKDPGLRFEELGVDQIYVDEAHYFKNLYAPTKIEGISMSHSQRAEDLYMKVRFLEGINPGRGVNFATATPISNSMTEVYTMMRYLQLGDLTSRGIEHFDSWAGMFGEHVTTAELAPDGSGYRMASRFARFKNLPELAQMFRRTWDVQRQADLDLDIPKLKGGAARVIASEKSPELEAYVKELVKRSENLRTVDPTVDNMLKITSDGRKAALDMRLVHPGTRPIHGRKAELAADNIFEIWEETKEDRLTQLVFCDFSTPNADKFNVYQDVKELLLEQGIPEEEIAFIHDSNTDLRKAELFKNVRSGKVRILLGSTDKMGVGTNVQKRLVAIHHMDAPWRPSDIEQRDGRGVRQGNDNETIELIRYVTEGSFDAYMWQGLERKQFFIEQIMSGDPTLRSAEDIGGTALNASEAKAIASGNPAAIEKASVDSDLGRLRRLKRSHQDQNYEVQRSLQLLPERIRSSKEELAAHQLDEDSRTATAGDAFKMRVGKAEYAKRKDAAEKILPALAKLTQAKTIRAVGWKKVGSIAGFDVYAQPQERHRGAVEVRMELRGARNYSAGWVSDFEDGGMGAVRKLENAAERIAGSIQYWRGAVEKNQKHLQQAKDHEDTAFAREDELRKLETRQKELEIELRLDKAHQEDEQVWQNEEGEGEIEYGPDGLTDDELRERDDAGFLDIRPLFERRPQRSPLVTSTSEEVEARFQKNKGIQDLPLFDRAKEGFHDFLMAMRRTHPEINPDESTTMAMNQDILRQFGSVRDWSMAMSYHEIRKVTEGLDENELDLLTRMLVLPDIVKDYEEGLYDDRPGSVPFYGRLEDEDRSLEMVIDELETDLRKFEAAVDENPKVAEALERRRQMNQRLTKLLVKAELLKPEVLEDTRYYHRQVMKYFQAGDFAFSGVGGPDVRLKKKGFQQQRVGGGDFNTAYQESEIEWMAQGWELLSRVETLQRLQELNDIKGQLKLEARAHNQRAIQELFKDLDGGLTDPLLPFRTKIAFSNVGLAKLAAEGELSSEGGRFSELIYELGETYADWKQEMSERDKEDREPFSFEHGDWFPFLSHLLEGGRPGAMQAGTIFKAIRQREAFIKEELGKNYIDPTNAKELARKLAPEGYVPWQPEKGTHLFLGLTVEERVLEAAIEEGRVLQREDVRQMLVMGGPKEMWIIPGNLARTLNNVRPSIRGDDAVENLWVKGQTSWKQWILLNPVRALKYNFNNMSGDTDIAFAYDPKIVTRYAVQAAKDLAQHFRGKASEEVSKEILDAIEMGVVGSGLRVAEIPDINETGAFRFLTRGKLNPGQKVISKYWGTVRGFTDWRENILRLAADRYFREKIEAGEENLYAASRRTEIDALQSEEAEARKMGKAGEAQEIRRRRSAKLARELIGDYGNISKGGIWLRRHMIPFYSWVEINAPRYYRLLKNIPHEGQQTGMGRRMSGVALKKGSVALLKMNVLFLLANLWNHLFFPEEEEELGSNRRQLHLILGRHSDGTIRSLRMEGALSDALEWFNLQDYPADLRDLWIGEKSVADQGAEFVKGPVERIINSWEPFTKTMFETVMGRRTYPTVFEEGASFKFQTMPIRDRPMHVLQTFSLNRLYSRVTGKPHRPSQGPIDDFFGTVLTYNTDPGEAAYWSSKDLVSKWQEERGMERSMFTPTQRSNALYYWKKAVQWGDRDAAVKWEREYRRLGGTDQGMRQSIRLSSPLGGLAQRDQPAFLASLTPKERRLVNLAKKWFGSTIGAAAPSADRPTPPSPPSR